MMVVGLIASMDALVGCSSSLHIRCSKEGPLLAYSSMISPQNWRAQEIRIVSQARGLSVRAGLRNASFEAGTSGRQPSRAVTLANRLRREESQLVHASAQSTSADVATSSSETLPTSTNVAEIGFAGVHHVGLLCENLERSLEFYCGLLGLELNPARPADKLPYRGAWLWVGKEMIHLMELPNPDPSEGRPEHGGRDRHACLAVKSVPALKKILDEAGLKYTMSQSGRAALFTRDPDSNALEFTQI